MTAKRTTRRWSVTDAKAHFGELLEASEKEGPQMVTRRGVETAVVVRAKDWHELQESGRPTLKELLLAESPRAEIPVPSRQKWRRRPPTKLG